MPRKFISDEPAGGDAPAEGDEAPGPPYKCHGCGVQLPSAYGHTAYWHYRKCHYRFQMELADHLAHRVWEKERQRQEDQDSWCAAEMRRTNWREIERRRTEATRAMTAQLARVWADEEKLHAEPAWGNELNLREDGLEIHAPAHFTPFSFNSG